MTQDTEDVVILSSVCGRHFDDDCESCQSAKDSNDYRLQSLSNRIDVLEVENERQYKALNAVRDRCFLADDANREHDILSIVVPITDQARAALHQEGIAP